MSFGKMFLIKILSIFHCLSVDVAILILTSSDVFPTAGDIDSQWNRVLDLLRSQLQTNTSVITMWGQYNDCASSVQHTLDNVHPITEEPLVFNTQPEVKQCLDRTKVGYTCGTGIIEAWAHRYLTLG